MPVLGLGPKTIAVVGIGLILAFYFDNSPPSLSRNLTKWMTEGKYFVHEGQKVFYHEGKSKRLHQEGALCLHGFPTLSYDWMKIWPNLVTKFGKVVAMDFLGFGFSDKPQRHNYSIMKQCDIVEALLDQIGMKKVHIIAHDYGDTVAQELLARYNHRTSNGAQGLEILSVVLLNGGIFPETNFPRLTQRILLIPFLNQILTRVSNIYTFKKGLGEVFGPNTQPSDSDMEDFWAALRHNDGHLVLPKLLAYIEERKLNRERWVTALQDTTVPVKVIYGSADPVNPPGFVEHYKKLVPNSEVHVLEGVGHYPQWEAPKATFQAILDFMTVVEKRL